MLLRISNSRAIIYTITYSTTEPATPPSRPLFLGTTNSTYASSIPSLSNKEPIYVVLASDSEDASLSFLHVRALCPVPLQFPQRRRAGYASSWSPPPRAFLDHWGAADALVATCAAAVLYSIVLPYWIRLRLRDFRLVISTSYSLSS
jgi:hypothetical protein